MDNALKTTEPNPKPDGAHEGYAVAPDGVKIRYGRWRSSTARNKGTIIFLQGRSEFVEKSYETVREMLLQGFDVISFDWRGQGGSDRMLENRRKGYVDDFCEYVTDLETIIEDVALPDCRAPFFIVAHSTGGLVALMAAPQLANTIRRMVLCSPFLGIADARVTQGFAKMATGALSTIGLGELYIAGNDDSILDRQFEGNVLTSDQSRYDRNHDFLTQHPELAIGGIAAHWLFAACKAMDQVLEPEFFHEIGIPTLFLLAGSDRVVDNRESEMLCERLSSGSLLTIDGAQHELLHEAEFFREQCLAAMFSYIPGG